MSVTFPLKVTVPVEAAVASCRVKVLLAPLTVLLKLIEPEPLVSVSADPSVTAPA